MDVPELLDRVGEHVSVRRSFGPAYEHDGALIVPVALVIGGGGGGHSPADQSSEGGGFGGITYPVGAYVAQEGRVRFLPAWDATVTIVGILGLLRLLVSRRRP